MKIDSVNTKGISFDNANYNIKIDKLENCFTEAKFNYSSSTGEWEIIKKYLLKGNEYHLRQNFNGYDPKIILPEEVAIRYTKVVFSTDEIWNTIEEIRGVYLDYYNHKEE